MRSQLAVAALLALSSACTSSSTTPSDGAQVNDAGAVSTEPILDAGDTPATPPDGASLCPSGACNYQTSAGCDSDGATPTCMPAFATQAASVATPTCELAGAKAEGEACASWDECGPGLFCAASVCRKLCCGGDWSACPSGRHCRTPLELQGADGGAVATGAMLCEPVDGCDPLSTASCTTAGTTCQIVDSTGATTCLPGLAAGSDAGAAGDPCPCQGGYTCVGNGCRRLCRAVEGGGTPACPLEEGRCVHWTRDPAGVGECTPT